VCAQAAIEHWNGVGWRHRDRFRRREFVSIAQADFLSGNSFQASLSGKLIDDQQGTRLHCRVGLHPFVTAFLAVWIGGVLIGGMAMIVPLVSGAIPANRWPQAMIPFLMLAGGVAILKVGQYLSRDEADFLVDFLRKTIDVRESNRIRG
jgi:hypothetical protein